MGREFDRRGALDRRVAIGLALIAAIFVWVAFERSRREPSNESAQLASESGVAPAARNGVRLDPIEPPAVTSSRSASDATSIPSPTSRRGPRIVTVDESGEAIAGASIDLIA